MNKKELKRQKDITLCNNVISINIIENDKSKFCYKINHKTKPGSFNFGMYCGEKQLIEEEYRCKYIEKPNRKLANELYNTHDCLDIGYEGEYLIWCNQKICPYKKQKSKEELLEEIKIQIEHQLKKIKALENKGHKCIHITNINKMEFNFCGNYTCDKK